MTARILVVDDEKCVRVTLREVIKDDGHEVRTARDVEEAMGLIRDHAFDVIVTGLTLPRITGLEFLEEIRRKSPDIQVIMMTGSPSDETAARVAERGAFDFLAKPVSGEAIRKVIASATKTKALSDVKKWLKWNCLYQEQLRSVGWKSRDRVSRPDVIPVQAASLVQSPSFSFLRRTTQIFKGRSPLFPRPLHPPEGPGPDRQRSARMPLQAAPQHPFSSSRPG